jgi:predicted TPR repeat methyltransferase
VHAQPTLFGLGHALRKQGHWDAAEATYARALGLVPRSASTLVAMAFTAQLRGNNTAAVELYHVALGLRPDDGCVLVLAPRRCACISRVCMQLCAGDAHRSAGGRLRGILMRV